MNIPNINYLVIGAPKCGTTTLCKLLGEHPDIFITNPKEPQFFCPKNFLKRRDWKWYLELFKDVTTETVIGEGSVQYTTSYPGRLANPELIYEFYPNLKLIYMMRNPIERIESHWLSSAASGFPPDLPNFDRTIYYHSMYLNTSRYWSHLSRFRRYFSDDQIHLVFLEEFKENPVLELKKIYQFLDVDPEFKAPNSSRVINATNQKFRDGSLTKLLRQNKFFKPLQKMSPKILKNLLIPVFKVKNTGHPVWKEQTLEWALEELRDDSLRLLEYAGKESTFWFNITSSKNQGS